MFRFPYQMLESFLVRTAGINLKTPYGTFQTHLYERLGSTDLDNASPNEHHLALVVGDVYGQENTLVRINSRCFLNESLGDLECECAQQLHEAQRMIQEEGSGVLIYLNQEGKGVGLPNKIKAIELVQQGKEIDLHDAYISLGLNPDGRNYRVAAEILGELGVVSPVRLLTNNPEKIEQITEYGIKAIHIPFEMEVTKHNLASLTYKQEKQGHMLNLPDKPM